jgi:hypothetical protein
MSLQPSFRTEAQICAKYILKEKPDRNTSPTNRRPMLQMQLAKFDGIT